MNIWHFWGVLYQPLLSLYCNLYLTVVWNLTVLCCYLWLFDWLLSLRSCLISYTLKNPGFVSLSLTLNVKVLCLPLEAIVLYDLLSIQLNRPWPTNEYSSIIKYVTLSRLLWSCRRAVLLRSLSLFVPIGSLSKECNVIPLTCCFFNVINQTLCSLLDLNFLMPQWHNSCHSLQYP